MRLYDDSCSGEEWDLEEDEDALVLMLHKNKRPKHDGSVIDHETLRRLGEDADNKLIRPTPVFSERYFQAGLGCQLICYITLPTL